MAADDLKPTKGTLGSARWEDPDGNVHAVMWSPRRTACRLFTIYEDHDIDESGTRDITCMLCIIRLDPTPEEVLDGSA